MAATAGFVSAGFSRALSEAHVEAEVALVVEELVGDVEAWHAAVSEKELQWDLRDARRRVETLEKEKAAAEERERTAHEALHAFQERAMQLREELVPTFWEMSVDLAQQRALSRRLEAAEQRVARAEQTERDLAVANRRLRELERRLQQQQRGAPSPNVPVATVDTQDGTGDRVAVLDGAGAGPAICAADDTEATGQDTALALGVPPAPASAPVTPVTLAPAARAEAAGLASAAVASSVTPTAASAAKATATATLTAGLLGTPPAPPAPSAATATATATAPPATGTTTAAAATTTTATATATAATTATTTSNGTTASASPAANETAPPASTLVGGMVRSLGWLGTLGTSSSSTAGTTGASSSGTAAASNGAGAGAAADGKAGAGAAVAAGSEGADGADGALAAAGAAGDDGAGAAAATAAGAISASGDPASGLDDAPLPGAAALAAAINKLTHNEMRAIIALTERSKRMQQLYASTLAEKQDIAARLQSTEQVKDFLVNKLKDTEVALKQAIDETSTASRQNTSDQEVISFLDTRVQELELELDTARRDKQALTAKLELETATHRQAVAKLKRTVRSQERDLQEREAKFRAAKRVLAREVKSLRREVGVLRTERDERLGNLSQLWEVLGSLQPGSGGAAAGGPVAGAVNNNNHNTYTNGRSGSTPRSSRVVYSARPR